MTYIFINNSLVREKIDLKIFDIQILTIEIKCKTLNNHFLIEIEHIKICSNDEICQNYAERMN